MSTAEKSEKQVGATEGGMVNVRLAHPLRDQDRPVLGIAADEPGHVGAVVTVTTSVAINMIGAGMVQVDPEDHDAVTALLSPTVGEGTDVTPGLDKPQPVALGADVIEGLRGGDLDKALSERNLSQGGTVEEKRERLAAYVPAPVV